MIHQRSLAALSVLLFATALLATGCPDEAASVLGVGVASDECGVPANDQQMTQEVFRLVNEERASQGLETLRFSPVLSEIAGIYACEMIDGQFFAHTNPYSGEGPGQRAVRGGYSFVMLGENLAAGQRTPERVMADWMSSTSGHRENILHPEWVEVGIAVRVGGPHGVYWVQEFGDPP